MPLVVTLLILGSCIIAFIVNLQVKTVNPDLISVLKFNFYMIPALFLGNVCLGMAFIKGHKVVSNLALLVASQSFIYYIFVLLFAVLLLGDKVSLSRAVFAFALMSIAVAVLRSS